MTTLTETRFDDKNVTAMYNKYKQYISLGKEIGYIVPFPIVFTCIFIVSVFDALSPIPSMELYPLIVSLLSDIFATSILVYKLILSCKAIFWTHKFKELEERRQ